MTRHAITLSLVALVLVFLPVSRVCGQQEADLNAVLSRLQAMGHGTYTDEEWQQVTGELDQLATRAEKSGDLATVVQAKSIKAMVFSDMRRNYKEALDVLNDAIREYGDRRLPEARRLFVQKAEVYAKMGDEDAVRRTIEEFRNSPNFDPTYYPYTGGQGREKPLTLVRPMARGSDSISVTAMEVAQEQARFAPGNLFPAFTVVDGRGETIRLQNLRGKVVLVDFWLQDWTPWRRDLAYQVSTYRRYHNLGFEVIGVALSRDVNAARSFVAANRLPWPQVYGDIELARRLGVFGEATSFLVDQNGMIVGYNLRSADLALAVQKALGIQ